MHCENSEAASRSLVPFNSYQKTSLKSQPARQLVEYIESSPTLTNEMELLEECFNHRCGQAQGYGQLI